MTVQKDIFFFFWNTSQAQDYKADSYDLENYNSVLMFNGRGTFLAVKCYKSLIERKQQNIWGACWLGFCVVQRWHGNNDHLTTALHLCDKEQLNSDHFLNIENRAAFLFFFGFSCILGIFLFLLARRNRIFHSSSIILN